MRASCCTGPAILLQHSTGLSPLVTIPVQEASLNTLLSPHELAILRLRTLTFQHSLYSYRLFCNFNINFKDFSIRTLQFN